MFGAVVALLLAAGLVAVGARLSASAQVGAVAVVVAGYDLGDTAFADAQTGTVSELRAVVYFPRPLAGRLPLIVVAHGSWWACDAKDAVTWPCPSGSHPDPSYRGYDYLGGALAANG
jgi:hypothetical protein